MEHTYGKFTTELYTKLVTESHEDRISSEVCGIDRWFDNSYGYDATKFLDQDGEYMDRVLMNLKEEDMKYRLFYIDHQRDTGQYDSVDFENLDSEEYEESILFYKYRMFVFDKNGFAIQMIGDFVNNVIQDGVPMYNKQWCATQCPHNALEGVWDWRKLKDPLYVEDTTDVVYQIIYGEDEYEIPDDLGDGGKKKETIVTMFDGGLLVIIVSVAAIIVSSIGYCVYQYLKRRNNGNGYGQGLAKEYINPETQCLLQHSA